MISTPASSPPASLPQSHVYAEGIVVQEQSDARNDARNRERIGLGVLMASIGAVLIISGIVVWKGEDKQQAAQNVMSATLPLYGTWVGTILAFYFSRNAFESASTASSRNAEIYNQFARGLVSGASPPNDTLAKVSLKSLANGLIFSENDLAKPLNDVVADMVSKERYKVIIVDAEKKYVDLISRINASAFLAPAASGSAPPANVNSPTVSPSIKDYLDWRKNQGAKAQPIVVYLPETATLADADAKLRETPGCRDVIVTIDGSPTSPVVVYVTDADIHEYK